MTENNDNDNNDNNNNPLQAILDLASTVRVAKSQDAVLNTECVYTMHTPLSLTTDTLQGGLYVSCVDFIGVAVPTRPNSLYLVICQQEQPTTKEDDDNNNNNNKQAPTKLGINVEGGFQDKPPPIDTQYYIAAVNDECQVTARVSYDDDIKAQLPSNLVESFDSIVHHTTFTTQRPVQQASWQDDDNNVPVSKYAADLVFVDNGIVISPHPADWKCQSDGVSTDNLWLNLSDGYIGGGRRNWDGSGGSNGALDHYEQTGRLYPLVVKLKTLQADNLEQADCYSYAPDEDGPVKIPNLPELLAKRGIQVSSLKKTEKSMAELEVELNATYAFDAITEEGANLTPVPLAGLQNLGNSCYINSVVQLLFRQMPELQQRYGAATVHSTPELIQRLRQQQKDPAAALTDIGVQTRRLAAALTSPVFQSLRLAPRLFQQTIAQSHVDFSTPQQQDAAQYLQYLLEQLDRSEMAQSVAPTASHLLAFHTNTRRVCAADQGVKYTAGPLETIWSLPLPMDQATTTADNKTAASTPKRLKKDDATKKDNNDDEPVQSLSMQQILQAWAAPKTLPDVRWSHLGNAVHAATETVRLANFPKYLVVQLQRYTLGPDWQPKKLKVEVTGMDQILDLTAYKATPPGADETVLPDDDEAAPPRVTIDEAALSQLMDMGFTLNSCKRALSAVGGSNVEAAMSWVFEHNTDPDFDDPLEDAADSSASTIDNAVVDSLVANLGCFTADQVRAALKACQGSADRAADWLFSHMDDLDAAVASTSTGGNNSSKNNTNKIPPMDGPGRYQLTGMISHIGVNTGSGHYVAHLRDKNNDDNWIIFNDEKVAQSVQPPLTHAYLYLYQRVDDDDLVAGY